MKKEIRVHFPTLPEEAASRKTQVKILFQNITFIPTFYTILSKKTGFTCFYQIVCIQIRFRFDTAYLINSNSLINPPQIKKEVLLLNKHYLNLANQI